MSSTTTTRRRIRGVSAAVIGLACSVTLVGVGLQTASPASATAGTPEPPTQLWTENFENGQGTTVSALNYGGSSYTGSGGETYTGDANWLDPGYCDGLIVSGDSVTNAGSATVGGQSCPYVDALRQLAVAIGNINGSADANSNHLVSAYTLGNPGAGVEAQTTQDIPLSGALNNYVVMSVNSAAENCGYGAPDYQFGWNSGSGWNELGAPTDGCTAAGTSTVELPALGAAGQNSAQVGRVYSTQSILLNTAGIGVRVENANGSGQGNDAAFDDLTLWDATPSLDKSFSPTTIPVGGVSTMTITVTNTSDLAAKDGWSFTDAFPAGLSVADPANASTTCASPTYAPVAGSTSISITANLDAGETFCTISVDVTASTNGTFRNGASNMGTNLGLKLPTTPATLTVGTGLPATGGGMGALPYGLVLLGLGSTAVVVSRSRRSLPASQR